MHDNRSEHSMLTIPGVEKAQCTCKQSKTISIRRQRFWYVVSSLLVLCLLMLSTVLILRNNDESSCQTSTAVIPTQPTTDAELLQSGPQEDRPRRKKCRKKNRKNCKENVDVHTKFGPTIVGTYKQVEVVNMVAYLKAEGGSFFYQKLAATAMPNLEIKQYDDVHYGQIYTAPMYKNEWPMYTDGRVYEHKDGLGTKVKATAVDQGDHIRIEALGGKSGPLITVLEMEDQRLKMTISLPEKENVTAVRYFEPN